MCYGSAGTQAAGLWEFLKEGAMSKPLHTGKASYSGVLSAYLSQKGFTAASEILEGEKGFCRAMVKEPHLEKLTENMSTDKLKIDINSFKPYACCKHAHAALYAIQELRKSHSLQPEDIAEIKLYVNDITNYLINNPQPRTPYGGKFSIQYCSAAMLKFGEVGITQFSDECIHNKELTDLMQRIEVIRDEAMEQLHAADASKLASRVEIQLQNGQTLTMQVDYPKGDPENPLTCVQLAVKVCVDSRVDAQAYCSFAAADAVNLYAAVLHKSVMRVDIFYASDNFFRLHKSFLLYCCMLTIADFPGIPEKW